ncbi:MAG: alpha-E domain-containing protein [Dehalococcoidia bacterium]|nr:alpha-E domain-containing protein [Dehalococcoidia bacterium]
MLSRSAQGLYWMGRYLERAERLCRLLQLQTEALVDRPVQEIHFGWMRIYGSMNEEPPVSGLHMGSEDFTLADSYTLADHLTFERTNPDSVWSCFSLARENARQMRHCISAEMWTRMNLAYLKIRELDIQDIWPTSPESFYAETAAEMNTFIGVAESTMYRDEGWSFMQLGRYIERAQLMTTLLLAQLEAERSAVADQGTGWTSLLSVCHAFDVYSRRFSVEVVPAQVLDLLVTDRLLPNSLCRSLDIAGSEMASIGPGPDPRLSDSAGRLAGRLSALVNYEWPDRDEEDREGLLEQVKQYCEDLHELVTEIYFYYSIDYPLGTFHDLGQVSLQQ